MKMTEHLAPYRILEWDSDFFGFTIAKMDTNRLKPEDMEPLLQWCGEHSVDCLYLLADPMDALTVRLAERHGFGLADVRLDLSRPIIMDSDPAETISSPEHTMRKARQSDLAELEDMAQKNHTLSRFFFDPGFPRTACRELYALWIRKSLVDYADVFWVVLADELPVGYVTCNLEQDGRLGVIRLLGVAENHRNKGAGRLLVYQAIRWSGKMGAERITVTTQARNIDSQRLYQGAGFRTSSVYFWYHKWFRDGSGNL
jgi:GNAT superfamily N-acetyltransferase